jgi:NTE family protein
VARLLVGRATGLVLSGGGARGFAQIGVLRALREAGVVIDSVGGSSIGGIIGAGVALEWSDQEMVDNYRRAFVEGKPLGDWTFPLVALTRGLRCSMLLRRAFGTRDIEDLPLPFFCVSADLTGGRAVVHREGPLWLWLRAASAVPGILPPVFHRGRVYVDGAVINNLPTDVMHADGIADIVAVDISADDVLHTAVEEYALPSAWQLLAQRWRKPLRPGVFSILIRAGMVNSGAASVERRQLADLLLAPRLDDVGLLEWKAYQRAIDAGYRHAAALLSGEHAVAHSPTMRA